MHILPKYTVCGRKHGDDWTHFTCLVGLGVTPTVLNASFWDGGKIRRTVEGPKLAYPGPSEVQIMTSEVELYSFAFSPLYAYEETTCVTV